MKVSRRATCPAGVAAVAVWVLATAVFAAPPPTTMPALGVLDRATQELYRGAETHLVRVRVPVRILSDHPLMKWQGQLDRKLLDHLDAALARGESPGLYVFSEPDGARIPIPSPSSVVHIECVGLVLSPRGDVLLPLHIDPALASELPAALNEQKMTSVRVQASDRMTGLTIVRLAVPGGTPADFATSKPATGSIVLMIAPTQRARRLAVWADDRPEGSGIVIDASGELAGIIRDGHALYPSLFLPVVRQLLATGQVTRPDLGARIGEFPLDDPSRLKMPASAARTTARVQEVFPDSAAAAAGVHADDLIVSLAGEPVADVPTFAAALANRGGRTEMHVLRDGQERSLIVDLRPR